jgi:hypothetical protein
MAAAKKPSRETPDGTVWLECDGQEHHVESDSEAYLRLVEKGAVVLEGDAPEPAESAEVEGDSGGTLAE